MSPTVVFCHGCGQSWPRHPCIEVTCPKCRTPPGEPCTGEGHHSADYCVEREVAAMDAGFLRRCLKASPDPKSVACPTCGAKAGAWCQRPRGHAGPFVEFHRQRRDLASGALETPVPPRKEPQLSLL